MDAAAATPGQDFARPGMMDHEMIELTVGGIIVKVGLTADVGLLGATAMGEAKDAVVENLTKVFGKYNDIRKNTTELSDIQQNSLDGTPDTSKQLLFDKCDEDKDAAEASVTDKRAKFEALASSTTITAKTTDADKPTKKTSTEELTDVQREEHRKFITELFEQRRTRYQEDVQTIGEKYRHQNLKNETILRQKDAEIDH